MSGVVTPILIMTGTGSTALNLETADQQYLLSAALITSALLSLIQITRFKIWRTGKIILTFNFRTEIPTFLF